MSRLIQSSAATHGHAAESRKLPALALSILLSATMWLSGCQVVACPTTVNGLHEPSLRDYIGPGFLAATAVVNRFVDAADVGSRGYDITITSRVAGLRDDEQIMFAIVDEPMSTVELGSEVLVVGRRQGPAGIVPAGCPVLIPFKDE